MVFEKQTDEIKNAYRKMTQGSAEHLKEDNYYRYFYNLVDTGRNYADFSYVRLVKFVDEKWVNEIEQALPSLIKVVQNPRKYIEEEREIVNIAMARNISSESVRHLLAHSNYIDEYREDGTVIPNKILNVYKEESLNTYENRFICTLIAELQFFVNRRYHAIFDESKDEMGVNFDVGSTIDNYTEVVDYKLHITIRDKQTDTENADANNMIFARITEIYKKVNMLTTTEFVATMRKFPAVKHPIVKTNAIAKNKDYKACHKLWNFIHTYTQVGYKVDMLKQDPHVSGDLKEDIYNSIVWNYAMLHNYMEGVDELRLDREKRKKEMDMREVRGLLEELVEGLDMPEDRLRKLIDTELTGIIQRRKQEKEAAQRVETQIQELEKRNRESDLVYDPKEAAKIKEEPQLDLRSEEEIKEEAAKRAREDEEILRQKVAKAQEKKRKKEEEQRRAELEAEARRKAAEAKKKSEEERLKAAAARAEEERKREEEAAAKAIQAIAKQQAEKERKSSEQLAQEKRRAVKEEAIAEVRKKNEERQAAYPLYFNTPQAPDKQKKNKDVRGK